MPTYQYRCTACAEPLEVVQSFTDDPLTECPDCGGELRKVFSSVGIVFKGSGFYRTDSRSSSDRQSGTTSPSAESKSGKSEKSDTSAAKSDTGSSTGGDKKSDGGSSSSTSKDSGSSTTKTSAA